ncbi:MAG: hypothetical protein FWE01_01550 [Firmicutes bacterium]|nr:hypothetical protein [Bacillota bacterium]
MFCSKCGIKLDETSSVCKACDTLQQPNAPATIIHMPNNNSHANTNTVIIQQPNTSFESLFRKQRLRKGASSFAIVVAILTLIGAFVIPLLGDGLSFSDTVTIVGIVIAFVLGTAFLIVGILFFRKDSRILAIILLVFFILYVAERIAILAMGGNFFVIMWLSLGIVNIIQLIQYLKIKD